MSLSPLQCFRENNNGSPDPKPSTNIINPARRSSPSKINKVSRAIRKPPPPSSSAPQQHRHPVIIYTHSPKIIHTHPRDFMALVQKLTGMSSPPPPPSTSEAVSARVRRGNGAAAADNNCYINKSGKIGEGNVSSSFVKAGSCSESDWITAGIGSQVNSSWVFRHPPSSANNFFLPSKPALLRNSTDLFCRNSDQTSYYSNLNFNFLN